MAGKDEARREEEKDEGKREEEKDEEAEEVGTVRVETAAPAKAEETHTFWREWGHRHSTRVLQASAIASGPARNVALACLP